MGSNNIGQDLGLIGLWLTVMADLFSAIGGTVIAEPEQVDGNTGDQQQIKDVQTQLQTQKKWLQKQQIQFELMQMQLELRDLEQQVMQRMK